MMESLIVLLVLAVLAVPVLLVIALVQLGSLRGRVSGLEREVERLRQSGGPAGHQATLAESSAREAAARAQGERASAPSVTVPAAPGPASAAPERPAATPAQPPPLPAAAPPPPPTSTPATPAAPVPPPRPQAPAAPAQPDFVTVAARWLRRWFTEGNVPVKVGMLVLLAGVAALLKYASDQGWMRVPVELRLAGVAAAAMAALVFGWRQRERKRVFGLSLQGGAIGVLLLVVFAAFKLYGMIPAGAAFALSVVLVAGTGVLSVKQNAMALAVFAILAGFLAPIWLSTGSGNHVALFGYYAVLNAGIFAIAWWRPWRVLNLLGFAFTWGIGTLWGVLKYRPEHYSTTEPFLLLFFAFYLLIPVLYARRRAAGRRDLIDGCLVFGTPLIAFSLQAGLLQGARMPLAFCALGLGALYAALAWWLRRDSRFFALSTPYALLGVGFATLAVPLALAAEATACVFALEGAALVWLGLRQQRLLPQLTGAGLQLAAAMAFAIGASDEIWDARWIFLNANFAGALLIALAGLASAASYRRSAAAGAPAALAGLYYLWGLLWWLGAFAGQIEAFVPSAARANAGFALTMATAWLAAEIFARHPWRALSATAMLAPAVAALFALWHIDGHLWPLRNWGWLAWAAYALLGWRLLRALRASGKGELVFAHLGWLWSWAILPGVCLQLWLRDNATAFGSGWQFAALTAPLLAMAAACLWRPGLIERPVAERFAQWRGGAMAGFALVLAFAVIVRLGSDADPAPLMWLPLLNPQALIQWGTLLVLGAWLASTLVPAGLGRRRVPLLALGGFALVTVEVLRSAHFWGGVAWSPSMYSASLVQTSLTVTWSVLGVAGWIAGSRRGQRGLWLAGAVLMAVVLAKLVLIDRSHLGNLLGIASFIAYGLLCTLVGYFAPAPPSRDAQADGGEPPSDPRTEQDASA
ncbi:membrane protein [Lysobacter enzymogenes]|uniref:Membrane protein n=1 Tax=Lysobacter enzymogenes TaxID=69 RepID=A0A0S2DD78_LYSEN|nr:membrane protein [Lysobacter enzymogenes]